MTSLEDKINECRNEVDGAIEDLHKRLGSIESIAETLHDIYTNTQHTDRRVNDIMVSMGAYIAKQEVYMKGFPNDDPHGHRKAHEAMIDAAQRRARFYDLMITEVSKYSILGVVSGIAMAIWFYLKVEVHK